MKFEKATRKRIEKELTNYFLPIHNHLGFDNGSDIHAISKHILSKVKNIGDGHSKGCKYFTELWTHELSVIMHNTLMKPKSKYFLRGLVCHKTSNKGKGFQNDRWLYYFVVNESERKTVEDIRKKEIKSFIVAHELRNISEPKKHLRLLSNEKKKEYLSFDGK